MNNYQTAFKSLYKSIIKYFKAKDVIARSEVEELAKQLQCLEKLVNKSVARQVKKYSCTSLMFNCTAYHLEGSACPMCRCELKCKYNYCPYCGQALDWRNDERCTEISRG